MSVKNLEPADVDPVQLRKTAWKLVLVMVLGAAGILTAYQLKMRQKGEENPNRPPIVSMIERNFGAMNQKGDVVAIYDLKGKVWFAVPFSVNQPEENKYALDMMRELERHYADNEDVCFVLFSIDGADNGVEAEQLKKAAAEMKLTGPRTWLLTSGDTAKQRGFIKDHMMLGIVSQRKDGEEGGKWKFPSQLALVDRGMHIRQRYDFKEAQKWQDKAEEELEKRPEIGGEEGFDKVLNAVEELKKTLYANTAFVLEETKTGAKASDSK